MANVTDTLGERGARYGDFTDHAEITQRLMDAMTVTPGWAGLNPVKRQALTVIADKIARILNGDPDYRDNWHDIQGYAKLAEDRCALPIEVPAHLVSSRDKMPKGGWPTPTKRSCDD